MKRGHQTAIAATTLALILAGILALTLHHGRTDEPVYKGYRLSWWLDHVDGPIDTYNPAHYSYEAQQAVQHIGTNALPRLLKWISYDVPAWRIKLAERLANQGQTKLSRVALGGAGLRAQSTINGFQILGTEAYSAVPDLLRPIGSKSSFVSQNAFYALESLPGEKLVIIAQSLTNNDATVRASAALYTNTIRAVAPQISLPPVQ